MCWLWWCACVSCLFWLVYPCLVEYVLSCWLCPRSADLFDHQCVHAFTSPESIESRMFLTCMQCSVCFYSIVVWWWYIFWWKVCVWFVECAFTSPESIESRMFVTCMQCAVCFYSRRLLQCGDGGSFCAKDVFATLMCLFCWVCILTNWSSVLCLLMVVGILCRSSWEWWATSLSVRIVVYFWCFWCLYEFCFLYSVQGVLIPQFCFWWCVWWYFVTSS